MFVIHTHELDDKVLFMFPRETGSDVEGGQVGLGGVQFVDVVDDGEVRVLL